MKIKYLKLCQVYRRYLIYVIIIVIHISTYFGHGKDQIWGMAQPLRVGKGGKDALSRLTLVHMSCVTSSLSPSFLSGQMGTPYLFCALPLPGRVSRHSVPADILALSSEADGTQGQVPE